MTEDQHFDDVLKRSRALVEAIKQVNSEFQAELESICARNAEARRALSNPTPAEQHFAERVRADFQSMIAADSSHPMFATGNSASLPLKKRRPRLMV
ncbi:MAG TPA: hypothetical protein VM512_16245 [Burkholderiaceae bacterium]|nr:hypothetical protein [Burkholderiaceae bacterium]